MEIFIKIFRFIYKLIKVIIFEKRLKEAQEEAKCLSEKTNKKYMVIRFDGKPYAVSSKQMKQAIKDKRFSKQFSMAKLRKKAISIIYPKNKRICAEKTL